MRKDDEKDVTIDELINNALDIEEAAYWDDELCEMRRMLADVAKSINNASSEAEAKHEIELRNAIERKIIRRVIDEAELWEPEDIPKLAKILEGCNGQTVLDTICKNFGTFCVGDVSSFLEVLKDYEKYFKASFNWDVIIKKYFEDSNIYGDMDGCYHGGYDTVGYFSEQTGHDITGEDVFRCISVDFIMKNFFSLFREYIIETSGGGKAFVEKVAPYLDRFGGLDAHTVAAICVEDDLGNTGVIDMKKLAARLNWKELIEWKDDHEDEDSIAIYDYYAEHFPDILKEAIS